MIVLKNATLINFHPAEVKDQIDIIIDGNLIIEIGRKYFIQIQSRFSYRP